MCGQYWMNDTVEQELMRDFPEWKITERKLTEWDIRPTDQAPVISGLNGSLTVGYIRWGLKGYNGSLLINARAETIMEKRTFRNGIRRGRIAVPVAGFYEWNARKEKNRFWLDGVPIMYLAGIMDEVDREKRFTIITTEANQSMSPVHDRMPLVLQKDKLMDWIINNEATESYLQSTPPLLERYCEHEQLSFF